MNIDAILVNHCSPTLAGLKMGSLLCLPRLESQRDYDKIIEKYNQLYNHKGLYFRILFACPQRTLLYVYRPAMVQRYIQDPSIRAFLQPYGYADGDALDAMLDHLAERFRTGGCFPHESGIFLGYPLEDVCGFITNKGNHAKICGDWKVYGNAAEASRTFHRFRRCRNDYVNRFAVGTTLESLIVA